MLYAAVHVIYVTVKLLHKLRARHTPLKQTLRSLFFRCVCRSYLDWGKLEQL